MELPGTCLAPARGSHSQGRVEGGTPIPAPVGATSKRGSADTKQKPPPPLNPAGVSELLGTFDQGPDPVESASFVASVLKCSLSHLPSEHQGP